MQELDKAKAAAVSFMAGSYPDRTWFIIGGALRDTDMGLPMKDVDIFVSGYEDDPVPDDAEDGARNAYLLRAFTVPWMGFELNIIFLRGVWDLERATDRCDFGICQIGYDPLTERTYRSDAYRIDRDMRTLTLCRDTVPERKQRMLAKFPDSRFRNRGNFKVSHNATAFHYNVETGKIEQEAVFEQ